MRKQQAGFTLVEIAIVLGAAMLASFIWAGVSGILVPLTLKRMGADPSSWQTASAICADSVSGENVAST